MRKNKMIKVDKPYNYYIKPVSRWIKVKYEYVTKRHSLADYADFSDSDNGKGLLLCFKHNNRLYAMDEFMRLDTPMTWIKKDGKLDYLSGYLCNDYSAHGTYIQIDDGGEYIRLFEVYTESEVCE